MKLCVYHSPCVDGFTAAWAFNKKYNGIEFHPAIHGELPPDVTGKDVFIVDFSYKRPILEEMISKAESLVVLDHHKTAKEDLADLPGCVFDMDKSGAMLAWEYCFPDEKPPKLVQYVQDRDLYKMNLPDSEEISASIFSYPRSFGIWTLLANQMEDKKGFDILVAEGEAILRKQWQDVSEIIDYCQRELILGGHKVPTINAPHTLATDAVNLLAKESPVGFAASYFDGKNFRKFSLRGNGSVDVSLIAKAYGGGGHFSAAGFEKPIGWEGDSE